MKLGVVGAGWAGLACAVEATRAGHQVTLFEAARTLGGRARTMPATLPDGSAAMLDNGQHILIGAYTATLALMRVVDVDPDAVLLRLPLTLRFPDGGGLALPRWPPPFDLLGGILGARGWSWRDKAALLRAALGWRSGGFRCEPELSVAALCARLTPRVMQELIEPLCLSALNTPTDRASGQVFLRVLHDALFGGRGGADLLLPRVHLGALLPDAAQRWLGQQGAVLRTGNRVRAISQTPDDPQDPTRPISQLVPRWQIDDEPFDRVVLACPPWDAARLAAAVRRPDATAWSAGTAALAHEAIATVYAVGGGELQAPLMALRSDAGAPAQFVFDRGRLGGPHGLLAFVVSANDSEREALQARVLAQGRDQLGLADLVAVQTVAERRATFACTPGLRRPPMHIAPGLLACGDYVEGPYPATIEGAVRSGIAAAAHP